MSAMPLPSVNTNPNQAINTAPKTASAGGSSGVQGLGSQLYAGATNATGSPMPVPAPTTAKATNATAPAGLNVSQNPGGGGVNNTLSGLLSSDQSAFGREQQNYYGQGTGAALTNYLQTGAGYNGAIAQQTVNATDNAMQQQINQQYGNLQTGLSNAGLSPNSSASALASSQFLSNASAQENQVAAQQYSQMYAQSSAQYQQALLSIAGVNNTGTVNQQTTLGAIGAGLTGGVGGLLQYTGGAAGEAGGVSSNTGILGSAGAGIGSLF